MVNVYPSFEKIEVRREYSEKVQKIFEEKKFDWDVCPAITSPNIFVKPNINMKSFPLNTEWCPFQDIAKISVYTKEGTLHLGIISYPPMKNSEQEKLLQVRGYANESINTNSNLFLLTKPLGNLECLVEELKNIDSVLLKKD
jgi:hypothetical protein